LICLQFEAFAPLPYYLINLGKITTTYMKKIYLIFLLLVSSAYSLYAQNTGSVVSDRGGWSLKSSWSDGVPSNGYTITINTSDTIYIDKNLDYTNGANPEPMHLKVYGVLEFTQAGKLKLPAGSTIEIFEGGDLYVPSADNNSTVLSIGDAEIRGSEIDGITGPAYVDETYIETLPVTLLYFKAIVQNQTVEINWAASKAWDFSHYELQRSANGQSFEWVATIDAKENTDYRTDFSYTDRTPLSGTSYYRLKAVDIDGKFEYKGLEVVQFIGKRFEVYPNPVTNGNFKVNALQATEGAQLILRDQTGRTVRSYSMSGREESISTAGLPAGLYILLIQTPQQTVQSQLLIR
jgi:hypothetical protein